MIHSLIRRDKINTYCRIFSYLSSSSLTDKGAPTLSKWHASRPKSSKPVHTWSLKQKNEQISHKFWTRGFNLNLNINYNSDLDLIGDMKRQSNLFMVLNKCEFPPSFIKAVLSSSHSTLEIISRLKIAVKWSFVVIVLLDPTQSVFSFPSLVLHSSPR